MNIRMSTKLIGYARCLNWSAENRTAMRYLWSAFKPDCNTQCKNCGRHSAPLSSLHTRGGRPCQFWRRHICSSLSEIAELMNLPCNKIS